MLLQDQKYFRSHFRGIRTMKRRWNHTPHSLCSKTCYLYNSFQSQNFQKRKTYVFRPFKFQSIDIRLELFFLFTFPWMSANSEHAPCILRNTFLGWAPVGESQNFQNFGCQKNFFQGASKIFISFERAEKTRKNKLSFASLPRQKFTPHLASSSKIFYAISQYQHI